MPALYLFLSLHLVNIIALRVSYITTPKPMGCHVSMSVREMRCILSPTLSALTSVANSPNPWPYMIKQPESNFFGPREIVGLIMGRLTVVSQV